MSPGGAVLSPAGSPALEIAEIGWVLFAGAALLFAGTMALLAWAVRQRATDRRVDVRAWILGGGVALPVVVLSALFLYAHWRAASAASEAGGPLIVTVVGHDWWWELRYRDPQDGREIVLANELHLPAGRNVVLGLNSGDVIHSFWVPALAGKVDMIPGKVQQLRLATGEPGRHRGQSAEFCGEQHAQMAFEVVVVPPARFDAWLRAQAAPAVPPQGEAAARGMALFRSEGCAACHSIRGLAEGGASGPDLTHVASRRLIGAASLAATEAGFARWVGGVQHLKRGARMPQYDRLDPEAQAALAAFLAGLR
jgi:cytochrome c oxidase subunit 2